MRETRKTFAMLQSALWLSIFVSAIVFTVEADYIINFTWSIQIFNLSWKHYLNIWISDLISTYYRSLLLITPKVFYKKGFLKISQNSQGNTTTLLKKTLARVFSCEICEIFKNTELLITTRKFPFELKILTKFFPLTYKEISSINSFCV